MEQEEELAHTTTARELVSFPDIKTFHKMMLMLLKKLLNKVQFLLPSMQPLLLSTTTLVVLLLHLHAEPNLIMLSWLLDTALKTELTSSLSRINGEQLGETMVTSRSVPVQTTIAVSFLSHLMSPSHEIEIENPSYQITF